MGFNYLNYARYSLAKLGAVDTISTPICRAKQKVSQFAQDLIDYYNTVAKVIYTSTSVTDVTTAGDLNGFRSMSTAAVAGILRDLSEYCPEIRPTKASGNYSTASVSTDLTITGLNARLDGTIEDSNRLRIDSGIVYSAIRPWVISIAWVPETGFLFSVAASPLMEYSLGYGYVQVRGTQRQSAGGMWHSLRANNVMDNIIALHEDGNSPTLTVINYNGGWRDKTISLNQAGDNIYFALGPIDMEGNIQDHGDESRTNCLIYKEAPGSYSTHLTVGSIQPDETSITFKSTPSRSEAFLVDVGLWGLRYSESTRHTVCDVRAANLMYLIINDILAEVNFS